MRLPFQAGSTRRALGAKGRAIAYRLAIGCIVAVTEPSFGQISIPRPNFGVPEFSETGGIFTAEVLARAGLTNTLWNAVLLNDQRSWTGTVEQAAYGTYVDNSSAAGYRLTIRVPAAIPPEVFQLAISHPHAGTVTNRNAVSVLSCIDTNFYMFHYADPQVAGAEPTDWDTGKCGMYGSIRELFWHATAVKLANPRFLFDTGDEMDSSYGTSVARYEQYKDAMCSMGVAILATRGNNDDAGITTAEWRNTIGVETYSLTMGSFYICQKDYDEDNHTTWLTNNYAQSFTNPAIRYRLFGQHFNTNECSWRPPAGQYPDLMLLGHFHNNNLIQTTPYYIIRTQQACLRGAAGFFQFEKSGENWTCTSISNPWFQLMASGPTSKLSCAYAVTNDGSATTNTAFITNNLAYRFWDGRLKFLMKFSALGYQVTNGVKLAEYAYGSETDIAVLVKVDIAPSASTTVLVSRIDGDEDIMADAWEMSRFGNLATATHTTDYDGDRVLDWQEYVADTDPTNPASALRITGVTNAPSRIIYFNSSSNRIYTLTACSNLPGGSWNTITGCEPRKGTGGPDQAQDTNAAVRRFYRLRVEVP